MNKYGFLCLSAVMMTIIASACITFQFASPTQTPHVINATPLPPLPTSTNPAPPPPTATPTLTPIPPTVIPPSGANLVKIFLIAVGDNGIAGKKIGCGDSLVAVEVAIQPTLAVLRAALTELFKLEGQSSYGESGLYNALYQSHLSIESLNIVNREAIVRLEGTLIQGGECDAPRVKAQLEEIALQFATTVNRVSVFINGVALDQLLSLQ